MLFIDEIHRLSRAVEEILYPAMEDFQLDIVVGKGPAASSIRLTLPRFTLVGATTRTGLITGPLRDRFGLVARLDYYDADELRGHRARGPPASSTCSIDDDGAARDRPAAAGARRASPTGCCAGCATSPRCAPTAPSTWPPPAPGWRCSASTSAASTRSTAPSSARCASSSAAARSGCRTLAISVGEQTETVEDVYEPFLIQQGLLDAHAAGAGRHPGGLRTTSACAPPPGAGRPACSTPALVRLTGPLTASARRVGRQRRPGARCRLGPSGVAARPPRPRSRTSSASWLSKAWPAPAARGARRPWPLADRGARWRSTWSFGQVRIGVAEVEDDRARRRVSSLAERRRPRPEP